ncbi:hypothetical protein Tco_0390584 [Tanacetum coccineum]
MECGMGWRGGEGGDGVGGSAVAAAATLVVVVAAVVRWLWGNDGAMVSAVVLVVVAAAMVSGGVVSVVMWGGGDGVMVGDEGRRQVAEIRPEVAGAAPEKHKRNVCASGGSVMECGMGWHGGEGGDGVGGSAVGVVFGGGVAAILGLRRWGGFSGDVGRW